MGEILPVSQGAEQETSSVQEIAIDAPAGIIEGNLMRCLITSTASGVPPNITMDDGLWQQIIQIEMDVALAGTMAGYYKIATASEPATYTARISGGANLNMTGQISQYSGVNTDTRPRQWWKRAYLRGNQAFLLRRHRQVILSTVTQRGQRTTRHVLTKRFRAPAPRIQRPGVRSGLLPVVWDLLGSCARSVLAAIAQSAQELAAELAQA